MHELELDKEIPKAELTVSTPVQQTGNVYLTPYQKKVDERLETPSKDVVEAINYLNGKEDKEGVSEEQVEEIVAETYLKGETAPTTETVAQFVGQLYVDTTGNATYQCTAITTDESTGVKSYTWVKLIRSTDYAGYDEAGVVKTDGARGIVRAIDGRIQIQCASNADIDGLLNVYRPIVPFNLRRAVKVGLTKNNITLTDEEQTSACDWLGVVKKISTLNRLYGVDDKGNQVGIEFNATPVANGAVRRTWRGQVELPAETPGSSCAIRRDYVDNLPDNLTLTDEQKAKWQNWLGLGDINTALETILGV